MLMGQGLTKAASDSHRLEPAFDPLNAAARIMNPLGSNL